MTTAYMRDAAGTGDNLELEFAMSAIKTLKKKNKR